jgi:hypothetical protein
MLVDVLLHLAKVALGATLVTIPVARWLERRNRSAWAPVPADPVPVGRSAYRRGEMRGAPVQRAPRATRVAAFLHFVLAGIATWDGASLAAWVRATRADVPHLVATGLEEVAAVLWVLAPLSVIAARRLLRGDRVLWTLAAALAGCALVGAHGVLLAGTQRLPREAFELLEPIWLTGALDVLVLEGCLVAFILGARAALQGSLRAE